MAQDEKQKNIKFILKLVGFICLCVGLPVLLFGMFSFFSISNKDSMVFSWCMTSGGMILTFIGGACLTFAYMGAVAKYRKNEIMPVVTDSANDLIEGTRDEMVKTSNAVKGNKISCSSCGELNDDNASYCKCCGKSLKKICSNCKRENDLDAKYCDGCGKEF